MAQEECEESTKKSNLESKTKGSICEGCKANPSKYKCPGCCVQSCSLPCVKAHKQATGCNGKRQLTNIIPLSKFDDNLLLFDYNLLEDIKRVADSSQRKRAKLCGDSQYRLPFPLKSLRGAAASRRTKILFLPTGMSNRKTNQSFYDNRNKVISWTLQWRFHSTDVVLHDHGVTENTNLCSVIKNHLEPSPWNHQLKRFCEEPLQSLKFFIRKFPKVSKSPFVELNVEAPIREQLTNIVIIEYPVIHVFLPSHRHDFKVIKADIRHKLNHNESIRNGEQNPEGVPFREEEIKEEDSSDPKVLDLMKYAKQDEIDQISHQPTGTEKELTDILDSSPCATGCDQVIENDFCFDKAEDEQLEFNVNCTVADIFDNMDFEIEQGLIDSYSDLIAESTFDDFFVLDGVFKEDLGLVEANDVSNACNALPVEELEELEEGEIPK